MNITYSCDDFNKSGSSEFCIVNDHKWDFSLECTNGEIVCAALNRDYHFFEELPELLVSNEDEAFEYDNEIYEYKSSLGIPCDKPIKSESEYSIKLNKVRLFLDEAFKILDDENYQESIEAVLLNKHDNFNTLQRFLVYRLVTKTRFLWNFESQCFNQSDISDNDVDIVIEHTNNIWELTEGVSYEEKLNIAKKYVCENNIKGMIYSAYTFKTFKDYFNCILLSMVKANDTIRKCENCNKYFYPLNRSDTLYCDRIAPQDNTKTCKEYGAIKAYKDNLKTNEAMGLYRKIYMSKQMLVRRYPQIESYSKAFEDYKTQAKQWKSDVKSGIKSEAEYVEWLKAIKERKILLIDKQG